MGEGTADKALRSNSLRLQKYWHQRFSLFSRFKEGLGRLTLPRPLEPSGPTSVSEGPRTREDFAPRPRHFLPCLLAGIQMDEEAWFSVTPEVIANHQVRHSPCWQGLGRRLGVESLVSKVKGRGRGEEGGILDGTEGGGAGAAGFEQ